MYLSQPDKNWIMYDDDDSLDNIHIDEQDLPSLIVKTRPMFLLLNRNRGNPPTPKLLCKRKYFDSRLSSDTIITINSLDDTKITKYVYHRLVCDRSSTVRRTADPSQLVQTFLDIGERISGSTSASSALIFVWV